MVREQNAVVQQQDLAAAGPLDVAALIDGRGIGPAQWRVIGLCALVAMLDGLDLQSIGLAASAMGADLHIAPKAFGVVFSTALIGLALGAFVLGPLADRIGRKGTLVAATLCFGIFTLCTARAGSLDELLVYRFLAGAGLGGAMPSFISLASEYVPLRRRATIVSLLWAGFPLGGVVGGLLGSRLIPAYGWPSIFIVGGILPILVAAVLLAVLPESASFLINGGKPAARIRRTLRRVYPDVVIADATAFVLHKEATPKASVRQLFSAGRATGTILIWISFFFAFMVLVTNSSWSPILLRGEGIAIEQSAIALAAYNFGSLFGSGAAGALVTRFGAPLILSLTLGAGAGAYALVGWAAPSVAAVTVAECLFGLLLGCASSGLIALAAIFYPTAIRSTGVGWATGIGRIGSASGPLVVGMLIGMQWPARSIFAVVAAAVLIGAVACALMGMRQRAGGAAAEASSSHASTERKADRKRSVAQR